MLLNKIAGSDRPQGVPKGDHGKLNQHKHAASHRSKSACIVSSLKLTVALIRQGSRREWKRASALRQTHQKACALCSLRPQMAQFAKRLSTESPAMLSGPANLSGPLVNRSAVASGCSRRDSLRLLFQAANATRFTSSIH